MDHGNPRQVFDFALSTTPRERALTFIHALHRIQHMELPEMPHLFQIYYTCQNLAENLTSLNEQMICYLNKEDSEKFVKKYEKTAKLLDKKFRSLFKEKTETFVVPEIEHQNLVYNEETFLFPRKVLQLLIDNPIKDLVISNDILEEIMLRKKSPYALLPNARKYYETKFMQNAHKLAIYIANVTTLHSLSREIYKNEMEKLLELGKCPEAEKYIETYKEILKKLN
jgi:hypothetical protein